MGYCDEFYVVGNIFGYTGDLQCVFGAGGVLESGPTVYFQTATEYGHITQVHRKPANVGREQVRTKLTGYVGQNELVKGETRFVQKVYQYVMHTSRSALVTVGQGETETLDLLAQAITRYTEVKPMYA